MTLNSLGNWISGTTRRILRGYSEEEKDGLVETYYRRIVGGDKIYELAIRRDLPKRLASDVLEELERRPGITMNDLSFGGKVFTYTTK
jgi:hypothetical protein